VDGLKVTMNVNGNKVLEYEIDLAVKPHVSFLLYRLKAQITGVKFMDLEGKKQ